MKQVHSGYEMRDDRYYMVYSDRFSHKLDKHIAIFDNGKVAHFLLMALSSAREHGYGKFELKHTIARVDSNENYNIYGGVFELTEEEVLRHIIMEFV